MKYIDEWLRRLGYEDPATLVGRSSRLGARAYAAEISDMLSDARGIGASHVYCVDDVPVVCFIDGEGRAGESKGERASLGLTKYDAEFGTRV